MGGGGNFAAGGCYIDRDLRIFFWTCCPEPATERLRASCQVEGGFLLKSWNNANCRHRTRGKTCKDSSECEGFCEADLSPDEISKITNGERVEKTGACGRWKNFFAGCFYIIEDSAVERFCAD